MNNTNTKTEYQTIRNFFTDSQWDVIDMALNEFQDHDDYQEVLDTIGDKLQTVFDNSVDDLTIKEFNHHGNYIKRW